MVNDNIIAITCEGIRVEGIITTRSSGDISMEITSPYLHLSKTLRKSFFARYPSSFLSAYGDEKAE